MATATPPVRPHPHLHQPLLFISRLPAGTTDNELAELLKECLPIRLGVKRDEVGSDGMVEGTIEFREFPKAEKALTTLSSILYLSPYPPPYAPLPHSHDSLPRIVSGLPEGSTAGDVWEALRPASLREVRAMQQRSWADTPEWLVEFWFEDDARLCEESPPQLASDQRLSIIPYNPRRTAPVPAPAPPPLQSSTTVQRAGASAAAYYTPSHSRSPSSGFTTGAPLSPLSVAAPSFVPSGASSGLGSPQAALGTLWAGAAPGVEMAYGLGLSSPTGLGISTFGPGQQVQPAPAVGPGSSSASGLIDPCNLFCKNLDPVINSQDLFNAFRSFGQIVSARVMKDDMGVSKGFGFVSFTNPQEAHLAMTSMDTQYLGEKQVTVRLHEPKKVRAEKLAEQRAKGLRGAGPMSPVARYGELAMGLGGAGDVGHGGEGYAHERRRSGGLPTGVGYLATPPHSSPRAPDIDDLATVTPDRRRGVLAAELHRRVSGMPAVQKDDVDAVVRALVGLDLGVVGALKDGDLLEQKVHDALAALKANNEHTTSPLLPRTATPSEISRNSSPAGTERDRLAAAVGRLEPDARLAREILEMIASLRKKDRALCLFNNDFLRAKVAEAKEILAGQDDESDDGDKDGDRKEGRQSAHLHSPGRKLHPGPFAAPQRAHSAPIEPGTPLSPKPGAHKTSQLGGGLATASTPASPAGSSVRGEDAAPDVHSLEAAAADVTDAFAPGVKTLAEVAALSAEEGVAYMRDHQAQLGDSLGPPVVEAKTREMKSFLEGLEGKPPAQQKQSLGERLFKLIRSWDPPRSIKAPKVTIHLLDSEDLHALGYLASDYPLVLREKVALAAGLSTWPSIRQ